MLSNFIAKKKRKRKNIFSILNHRTFLPKIACPNHQRSPINISRSSPDVELIIFFKAQFLYPINSIRRPQPSTEI